MQSFKFIKQYPSLRNKFDNNYNVKIPSRKDPIDRSQNSHYNSYEEVYKKEFPEKKFEIKELPGKGRGLVAVEDIHAGELVFKEQATIFFEGEEDSESNKDSTYYMVRSIYDNTAFCSVKFATELAQNHQRDEEFSEHVKFIYEDFKEDKTLLNPVEFEDIKRIVNGIHTNSFSLDFIDGYAVFIACSLANHSCKENVGWHTVGDVMYWTALVDIPKGTEITISYTFPSIRPKRIQYFQDNYGFICDCPLCSGPIDPWRAFKCSCGGIIYPEPEGYKCHSCEYICTEEEINQFNEEEDFIIDMEKLKRHKAYYNPLRKMHDTHLFLFKAMRKYVSLKSCPNPLEIFEQYLIPVAKYQVQFSHGRVFAAVLEQYGVALMKYSKIMPDLYEYCKTKALESFQMAYDYRCSLGMGRTGYAAAVLQEHLDILDPKNLNNFVEYDEY
ncbi:hypothetical protein EHI8A_035190 [Entamoeba histolytica HM-1:IMSS-B]|uniref:SET domain-containing protein n=5 Tax=Entamoeba histolytica TaxID=5759 RepID=C4M8X9_ENTH1|nr:hypothetical protein EHI_080240 [Entamoeba histolytica HM-1:IMSS]EMD44864.1 set and mynd domain containing protein [Entamoeba histolytica KU27]EMH75820.1 hypothetical protein EHI8A_035190 [Entamoeba histolytica HM-1:IMSS-B]ENY64020.1 set and mynd domain containing protein [Entamoeba histolytica HM-1:IMSS-A]GAT98082.1 hypothetical protein CL6EHI_080240 [Entamoeba histolytica]EAL44132.1 hypothetical protein EHI_080240 [Entamoeba histolytica HM-1:IMSS]|eukprot:XP_649518.1 hypothetical protein EHI_080240 [Entamoeba histolytica HM-1:IMSS]